jgi:uncharacterized protein (TIGR02996 family)
MAQKVNPIPNLPKARPEVAAFLAAAKDEPEDDAPRLVLCDWLQEHGDEHDAARAEFVRLQCLFAREALRDPRVAYLLGSERLLQGTGRFPHGLAGAYQGLAARDARLGELWRRAADLLKLHGDRWLGPLRERSYNVHFLRGLISLAVAGRRFAVRLMAAVAASEIGPWLEFLRLDSLPRQALGRTARCPLLAHLRTLDVAHNPSLGAEGLRVLASSPHLARLACLNASCTSLNEGGAAAVTAATGLTGLRELALGGNNLGPQDAAALAAASHLGGLTSLYLGGNHLGAEGVRALGFSPHMTNLLALNLISNGLGVEGVAALAGSPGLDRLTMLGLANNALGPEGLAALLDWPGLERLTVLDLNGNHLGDAGAALLAASPRLAGLGTLHLQGNALTVAGAEALATSPHLDGLKSLALTANPLGLEGARVLACASRLKGLASLKVWKMDVGEEGEKILREHFGDRLQR